MLVGEGERQRDGGEVAGTDEDLAEETARPLLFGERELELRLVEHAAVDEQLAKGVPGKLGCVHSVLIGIGRAGLYAREVARTETTTDARRALLGRLIDHAPLFPPASLPPDEALAEDRRFRSGPYGWLVKRFVVPASKLPEVTGEPLPLSVVLDSGALPPPDDRIEAVEAPPALDPDVLVDAAAEIYVEVQPADAIRLDQLAALGLRAKVRCGGERVPRPGALAEFIWACRRRGLAFKATAGLHHPVRSDDEHGFLNLLAAAIFGDEGDALEEEDAAAFRLTEHEFAWRDRTAGPEEIARVRTELFVGFGSCSAQEPVDALLALDVLPSGA